MHIIINAGGTGTRLWPYSTSNRPKQFVPLVDDESFLRKTYNRLVSGFPQSTIWVNTNARFLNLTKEVLPDDFPEDHILTEPEKRDNFAAIISHAAVVAHRVGTSEPLLFLHADHLIPEHNWETFNQALTIIAQALESKQFAIITAGVKPSFPNTQLGYIQVSPKDVNAAFDTAVKVEMFKEKPDAETAQSFVDQGNYLWNLGYFSFTFDSLLSNLERFAPEVVPTVMEFLNTGMITPQSYAQLPKIAFDYAIAEKTDSLGVVGIAIDWEDIGNWDVAAKYLPEISHNPNYFEIKGGGNKVKLSNPKQKVAFVGVSNLVVVESEDGLLIVNPEFAGDVKKAAEYFEASQ